MVQSALCIHSFCINQPRTENIWDNKKFQKFQKAKHEFFMWQLFTLHLYRIYNLHSIYIVLASLVAQTVKSACSAGDLCSIPGLGRSPGEGSSNPLQYSCLENPMDRGAWQATVHGVAKSWTDWVTSLTYIVLGITSNLKMI